jgi:phage terminase small subunit
VSSKLTGKQEKFVAEYLNGANFNATLAASRAGYKATSKHSFESIGSENLQKPAIKARIDEFFAGAKVSAEETLTELAKLARGNSKDKIRALALLSQHHGLLDGRWEKLNEANELIITVNHRRGYNDAIRDMEKEVNEYNAKALKSNQEKEALWQATVDKYNHSPVAVRALVELREIMLGKKEGPEPAKPNPIEVEIIPPQRRLPAAPIERMMAQVPERPQTRCRHGNLPGKCFVVDVGQEKCANWYENAESSAWKQSPLNV